MQTSPDRGAAIHLQGGESLFVYLKAGTAIVSTAGMLELTGSPRWLGGEVFPARAALAEGEAWLLEENGWLTVAAVQCDSSVSVFLIEAPAPLRDWWRQVASVLLPGRAARPCA